MIKFSCDSTADLSPELYERYGVSKLPLYINLAGREYMDGVDLTADQLFKLVDETGELPSTFHYSRLAAMGFDRDVEFCFTPDVTDTVPVYRDGVIVKL